MNLGKTIRYFGGPLSKNLNKSKGQVTLVLLICWTLVAQAQKDSLKYKQPIFQCGSYLGPNYTIPQTANFTDPSFTLTGKPEWGYEIGGRMIFRLGRYFSFASGVSFSEINYYTHLVSGSSFLLDGSSNYYSINLPLHLIGKIICNKNEYYLGVGEENSFFFKYVEHYQTTTNGKVNNFDQVSSPNDLYFRPSVFIGMGHQQSKAFKIFGEVGFTEYKYGQGYFSILYTTFLHFGVLYSPFLK
jgi:hypothetical protein